VLACVISQLSAVAGQTRPETAGPGLIAGRVLDVTTGQPVAGATVSMSASPAPAPGSPAEPPRPGLLPMPAAVQTDSQGRFAFPSIPGGRYVLRVQHKGYVPVRGAAVSLLEGQTVSDLALQVGRHGVIAGTVRDDGGDPVVGVTVRALNRRLVGFRAGLFLRGSAVTDDRGQFRIADLPPGEYLMCVCVRDALPIDKALLNRMGQDGIPASSVARRLDGAVLTFPPTFHPGTTRVSDAISITVSDADDRRGIDITMQPAAAWRVSGRLVGGGSNASTTHTLTLVVAGDDPAAIGISELSAARMTPEGAFEFAAVPPGTYTLEAYPTDGKKGLGASVPVTVGDSDVTDVMVPLGTGATVRGRVEFSGSAARPTADTLQRAGVTLVPIVLTPAILIRIGSSGSVGHRGILSSDGSFTIEGVPPGRYLVDAGQFGGTWQTVEAISTADGRSLQPVLDVVPTGVEALVVTMSDLATATLEVTLPLAKYELSNELRVSIFPVDRTFWSETYLAPGRFTLSFANTNGIVNFPAVPPGDYYVVETPRGEGLMSPERMAEFAKRATTVRLRPGEKTTVALRR
jgi:hypothetical protein